MTEPNTSAFVEDLLFQAELFVDLREWKSADEVFRKALVLDKTPASRIAYGVCLAEQERYYEAITTFTPVLDGTNRTAIGIVCHNLAAIYRDVGDADLARRFQWRATLSEDHADERDLLGMANDALTLEHNEVAESLVSAASEMAEADSDPDLIATAGLFFLAAGSTSEALSALFTAYRRHQAASDYRKMGTDLMNLSVLFGEAERHRAERACVVRAIRCFEMAPAPHSHRNARLQLDRLDQMQSVRSFDVRRN